MIPRKIHFIYGFEADFGGKSFSFAHWVAIRSAQKHNPGFDLHWWYTHLPQDNYYFEDVRASLILHQIEAPSEIFGRKLIHFAHKTDLARLLVLQQEGGVYLDVDTVTRRSFEPYLNETFVICQEQIGDRIIGLCNAVMMAEPNTRFATAWIETFRGFRSTGHDEHWAEHAVHIPLRIATEMPDWVTILPTAACLYPDWSPDGLAAMFVERHAFPDAICHHLWESASWGALSRVNEMNVEGLDTSYGDIVKAIVPNELVALRELRQAWVRRELASSAAKINLGSGSKRKADFINCDMFAEAGPDLVFDLAKDPWPIPTGSVALAEAHHVAEHLAGDLRHFFTELYRVMAPGGEVDIQVPHPRHDWFIIDPTHVRPWHIQSFEYLDRQRCLNWFFKGDSKTPLALYWGIDFQVTKAVQMMAHPSPLSTLQNAHPGVEPATLISLFNNVISEIRVRLRARKAVVDCVAPFAATVRAIEEKVTA